MVSMEEGKVSMVIELTMFWVNKGQEEAPSAFDSVRFYLSLSRVELIPV